MEDVKVEKRNGQLEAFNLNKVKQGVIAAGGSEEEAQQVASYVETKVKDLAADGVDSVKSTDIRDMVLMQLDQVNPNAAASFREHTK